MTSERECYVYIVLPGTTSFVTAGRFNVSLNRDGNAVGRFIYGRKYLERDDVVEIDPTELRLRSSEYETARMGGFFGAIRDSMPDFWGRRVIEKKAGHTNLEEFDYLMLGPDDRAGALAFGVDVQSQIPQHQFSRIFNLVHYENPCPQGKVRVHWLCHLNDSMLLLDRVVPTTTDQGVNNESIHEASTNDMALPVSYCLGAEIPISDFARENSSRGC